VNRLTEGWDVLNLFDIVRLYKGRDEYAGKNGTRKIGNATVSEIQLIGRGIRYYPFSYNDKQRNKRKFDSQLDNEMRVLEELYYHSDSDHRYIEELKRELKKQGFIDDGKVEKRFNLKKEFVESDFYKGVRIWKNEQVENPKRKQKTLDYLKDTLDLKFDLQSLGIREEELGFGDEGADTERLNISEQNRKTLSIKVKDFEKHIFQKAVNVKAKSDRSLLRFDLLAEELQIESIDDFREKIVGDFEIKLVTTRKNIDEVSNEEKLDVLVNFFEALLIELKRNINPYIGTEFTAYKLQEFFGGEIRKRVKSDEESTRIEDELKYQDWYVVDQFYGTSEEKGLIEFVQETIVNLQGKYKEVYLLRNEEQYKIYDFGTGRGFQPDFILFLKNKSKLYYQIFIEPKGDNLLDTDKWKNDFLKEITEKYSNNKILKVDGRDYSLIGLPLFNKKEAKEFTEAYDALLT
jgi:type III restriction enzyme